ncbi:hypothetical protein A0H81_14680 [Grifola frondosa]|uniref:Uncharacterized protein n=1 Tax=Grifola frondosa TaxID=5627 RepID=A0A1C7LMB5_GRIFR|nr:hypothetical protein A0H81_14680 [Grifola frondosa]
MAPSPALAARTGLPELVLANPQRRHRSVDCARLVTACGACFHHGLCHSTFSMVDRSAYCAGHAREMNTVGAYLGSYALPILRTSGSYGCFLSCADVDGTVVSRQCLRMFQIHRGANDGDTYHDCELEQNILHVRRILPYADVSYMAAGVDKDQEVAAGIDVKEAAAAAKRARRRA